MAQRILRLVGVVSTAAALVLTAAWPAQAATHWRIEQRIPDTATVMNTELQSVATVSTHSVWTVGSDNVDSGARGLVERPLVEHWNGHGWHRFTAPPVPAGARDGAALRQVVAGANGLWVIGAADFGPGADEGDFVAHWDGKRWVEKNFGVEHIVTHLAVLAKRSVWALGFYTSKDGKQHGFASGWAGKGWTTHALSVVPEYDSTHSVSQTAPRWAAAHTSNDKPALLHWSGHAWALVAGPKVVLPKGARSYYLASILDLGTNNVWATVAYGANEGLFPGLTLFHRTKSGWHRTLNLRNDAPYGLAADGTKALWLVSSGVRPTSQLLHVTRAGTKVTWRIDPPASGRTGLQFSAIAAVGHAVVAVGGFYSDTSAVAAIARFTP